VIDQDTNDSTYVSDSDGLAVNDSAVQSGNARLGIRVRLHLDEAETSRLLCKVS
jgi:hypothetical protein